MRSAYLTRHRRRRVRDHVMETRQDMVNDQMYVSRDRLVIGDDVIDDRMMRHGIH
jgi:hypothetical protein